MDEYERLKKENEALKQLLIRCAAYFKYNGMPPVLIDELKEDLRGFL